MLCSAFFAPSRIFSGFAVGPNSGSSIPQTQILEGRLWEIRSSESARVDASDVRRNWRKGVLYIGLWGATGPNPGICVGAHPTLPALLSCSLPFPVLRNDLYCVECGVKLYSLTHPSLNFCLLSLISPLEVGLLKPAMESGERCKLSQPGPDRTPAETKLVHSKAVRKLATDGGNRFQCFEVDVLLN